MPYVWEHEVAEIKMPKPAERTLKILASPTREAGGLVSKHVTFGVAYVPAGGMTSAHVHGEEEEVALILSGRGHATIAEEKFEVGPGCAICFPQGVRHQVTNESDETMKIVWVYAPPGIEKRMIVFKKTGTGYK
ncbi:MAG: cupin domain-containing protein [Candidatus Bathyarchaeia archaeon]